MSTISAPSGATVWLVFEYAHDQWGRELKKVFSTKDEAIAWIKEDNQYTPHFTQLTHKEWQFNAGGNGRICVKKYILDAPKIERQRICAAAALISWPIDGSDTD